jgi:mannose-6-phosphate isomerase class I
VYQHSSVSRDILVEVLQALGAEAVPAGRSETFIPVDTEALDAALLQAVQSLVEADGGTGLDAVVSADGDGDRPLVLAVQGGRVRLIPGDLLGLLAADFLKARAVTVPINANDAVDLFFRQRGIEPRRTRIGSPYVIAALEEVGWEANGGFLTAVPLSVPGGGSLAPLATRDALLPILCSLAASLGRGMRLVELLDRLPPRFGHSNLLRQFPRDRFLRMAGWLTPRARPIDEARYGASGIKVRSAGGAGLTVRSGSLFRELERIRRRAEDGFGPVAWINWLDGIRIGLANGEVVHLRASSNAPESRVYANAGSPERAERLVELVQTGGILDRLEREAEERQAIETFRAELRALRLRGTVQHYAWGGAHFIPELVGADNPRGEPFAELWLGGHPRAPAAVELEGGWLGLDRLLAEAPEALLGRPATHRFGARLPYLLKIVDAKNMLSIQVHPSLRQARDGFARENAAGIPLEARERNYLDDNHKPEVQAVLSDFWMLRGFRPLEEIAETLEAVAELGKLFSDFGERLRLCRGKTGARRQLLRELYQRILSLPQPEVDALLDPRLARLERKGNLDKGTPDFWVLKGSRLYPQPGGHRDRGLFSIYLLNLVHLHPGQGSYQPAGMPHAYLEGASVELMANSDNVLRGGLTPKNVDTTELLKILSFESCEPQVLEARAVSSTESLYLTPAREFRLSRIEVSPGRSHSCGARHGPDCLIVLQGEATVLSAGRELPLPRGGAVLVPSGLPYAVETRASQALLYRATVPI